MARPQETVRRTRVMVASSYARRRAALAGLLDRDHRFEVVARAADGDAVVDYPLHFDIAVVDLEIGGSGILDVIRRLRDRRPPPLVTVVSTHDATYVRDALTAEGVADFLLFPGEADSLPDRLERLAATVPAGTGPPVPSP